MSIVPRRPVIKLYQLASGRRILDRLDELNRTQWLRREELLALQQKKLHSLLAYAYQYVPYYHKLFDQYRFSPDEVLSDVTSLSRLPVLTKGIIRENFEHLQTTESRRRSSLVRKTTSGSTGHPLVFMQDSDFRDCVTADIHRHLGWAGWRIGDVHCYLWASHLELAETRSPRTRFMNWTLNRFVTNAFALSDESMAAFASEIRRRRPEIIFGYPSSLCRFATFLRERNIDNVEFRAIFSSAEMIYPEQRRFVEDTFKGRLFNRYGTLELGGIGCECEAHTGMHISTDNNYLEIVRDGRQAQAEEMGDIVVTNLNNFGMPFIRYSPEDTGTWSGNDSCPCGRELPMMDLTQGRRVELFKTRDGRAVRAGYVGGLFGQRGIRQFQVVQKSFDLVVVRIVKDSGFDPASLALVERELKSALGEDTEVKFEFLEEIAALESGKYRYAFSEIGDEPALCQTTDVDQREPYCSNA